MRLSHKHLKNLLTIALLVTVQNWIVYHQATEHHDQATEHHDREHHEAAFADHHHPHDGWGEPSILNHGHSHEDHAPHSAHDHELLPIRLVKADVAVTPPVTVDFRGMVVSPPFSALTPVPANSKANPATRSGYRQKAQPRAPPLSLVV